jgi:hypothetical protein
MCTTVTNRIFSLGFRFTGKEVRPGRMKLASVLTDRSPVSEKTLTLTESLASGYWCV